MTGRRPLPPLALTISFIDAVNHADLIRLAALMHAQHRLEVLDEPALVGREANVAAWRGYFTAYPRYVIHPYRLTHTGWRVAVLGATTGSHLDLADSAELQVPVIWWSEVKQGLVYAWRVREATDGERDTAGFNPP